MGRENYLEVETLIYETGRWARHWVTKGSPVDQALHGAVGELEDDIRARYRLPKPAVTTIRIALGPMPEDQFRPALTEAKIFELANVSDSMEDRDANLHTEDARQLGILKSWEVKPNYDMGGRLELVIEIEHVEG